MKRHGKRTKARTPDYASVFIGGHVLASKTDPGSSTRVITNINITEATIPFPLPIPDA
jgi:hypothetical protein